MAKQIRDYIEDNMKRLLIVLLLCAMAGVAWGRNVVGNQASDSSEYKTVIASQVWALRVTALATENSDSIYVHCHSGWISDSLCSLYVAIYSDDGGTGARSPYASPLNLLAQSASFAAVGANPSVWYKVPISYSLTSGTHYWIAAWNNTQRPLYLDLCKSLADTTQCHVVDVSPLSSTWLAGGDCWTEPVSIYMVSGVAGGGSSTGCSLKNAPIKNGSFK
jgi:hypothetical protein